MDDLRIEWIRDRVYEALDISDREVFEEFLERDEESAEIQLARFLNEEPQEGKTSLIFYKVIVEEEREFEVEVDAENQDLNDEILSDDESGQSDHDWQSTPVTNGRLNKDGEPTKNAQKGELKKKDSLADGEEKAEDSSDEVKTKVIIQKVDIEHVYMHYEFLPSKYASCSSIYFIRTQPTVVVPMPQNYEEMEILPEHFEYGLLNGHTLVMLDQIINNIYLARLSFSTSLQVSTESKRDSDNQSADGEHTEFDAVALGIMKDEFLMAMKKFIASIARTIYQIEGEVRLEMSDDFEKYDLTSQPAELLKDKEFRDLLINTCGKWMIKVKEALHNQLKKEPQGKGPLAEIDFWREKYASLSALIEQLNLPQVKQLLDIYQTVESSHEKMLSDLHKYNFEAKDNVRFLSTLERHFKNIAHGASFRIVSDTIPPMMNVLRKVCIISRHYNKDERMVPLMVRIAWELAERVVRVVNIRKLFELSREDVKKITMDAKNMLKIWKDTYLDVRAKIEACGRDQRWEFDQKKLFERTDYMATICQDLYDITQVLDEFYNIFGFELKAVTGDAKKIENVVLKVDSLVKPLSVISFDPFSLENKSSWRILIGHFTRDVDAIEKEAKGFIDKSFKNLRSAEAAFDLLLNFQHIRSREAINKQMMMKFSEILEQYMVEVMFAEEEFFANKNNPVLYKGMPPNAGRIYWERALFNKIKRTIIRFQSLEELMLSEDGKKVIITNRLLISR